jgi:penicillin V acylase-like amidase (Ntn superfamily)
MPAEVLTNSTYDHSLNYLRETESNGGKMAPNDFNESMDRFVRLTQTLKDYKSNPKKPITESAFDALGSVSVESENHATQWSIVYDAQQLTVVFKTYKNKKQRTLRLGDFDYSCDSPPQILNIEEKLHGKISGHFIEYTTDLNRDLIKSVFAHYKSVGFMKDMPNFVAEIMATYPESLKCHNH